MAFNNVIWILLILAVGALDGRLVLTGKIIFYKGYTMDAIDNDVMKNFVI